MTGYLALQGTSLWYFLWLAALVLLTLQLLVLLLVFTEKHLLHVILFSAIHFLAGFALFVILLDGFFCPEMYVQDGPRSFYDFESLLFSVPWVVWAGVEILSAAFLIAFFLKRHRYRRTHLSADAVVEAVDLLPAAICVSAPDGTVLLTNLKMTGLCRLLTGGSLTDAVSFWNCVEEISLTQKNEDLEGLSKDRETVEGYDDCDNKRCSKAHTNHEEKTPVRESKETYLVRTSQGEVWHFSKSLIMADGRKYDQILAQEMTQPFEGARQIAERNRDLLAVQERMRAVSIRERELIRDRETMNARQTVHNQIGNVLLTGRYYLDHPEDMDEEELLQLLEYNNHFLIREAQQGGMPDAFREAMHTARRIGVTVRIEGAVLAASPGRDILAYAIEQCAANAVRHARGNELTVRIEPLSEYPADGAASSGLLSTADPLPSAGLLISITNNGQPPAGPIQEGGGLSALRRTIEDAGGTMTIKSEPFFRLTLQLPDTSYKKGSL